MGLSALFFRKSICEYCQQRPSEIKVTLPDRSRRWVCRLCADECDEVFGNALGPLEICALVDSIPVDEYGIWKFYWGTNKDTVIDLMPPEIAKEMRESKSESLASYVGRFANRPVRVTFAFDQNGLREVDIAPHHALKCDFIELLCEKYGNPLNDFVQPGLIFRERRTIWKMRGYEIDTVRNEIGFGGITLRRTEV